MSIYTNTLSNNIAALTTTRFETRIQNDRIYEIDKYLSEIQHLLMRMLLSESKTFILNSPTGTGKNDTFLYLISELKKRFKKKKFVIVYPSNLSNEAKTEEYSNSENNWRQLDMNILSIDQYTDATTRANIGSLIHDADVIHIVANSYKYIAPYVNEDWVFIVDEVHKATTQHQIAPLDEYQQIINSPATKILMTGTLFDSFKQEFDFPTIYVDRKENPEINLHCCEIVNAKGKCLRYNFKNRLRHLENAAMNFIPTLEKKGKVHIIYIQDKNAIDRLADYTEKMGMKAAKIYSADEIRNNSKIYNYLVNGQPIPMSKDDDSIVIISTSLSYDSINLNNEHEQIGKIAVFGEPYTQNVRQLVARPRKAKELDVYYFRLKRPQTKKYTKTYAQFRAECQKVVGEYHKLINALLKIKTGLEMASEGVDEFSLLTKANTELKKIIPYATFKTVKEIKYKLKNLTKNKNHLPHDILQACSLQQAK